MIADSDLSPDERSTLEKILADNGRDWDQLAALWARTAKEVKDGYPLSIYDLTNDLWQRDGLAEIEELCPSPIREKLTKALRPLDEDFEEATRQVERPIAGAASRKRQWWWYRVPKKLTAELEKDFRDRGLLG